MNEHHRQIAKQKHPFVYCFLALSMLAVGGGTQAALSPVTPPAQGLGGPFEPLMITLDRDLVVGQASTVSASGYNDPDGDPIEGWHYEWRSAANGAGTLLASGASYTPVNINPVYVRVRALASRGYPAEQLTGTWQEVVFTPTAGVPDFGVGCTQGTVASGGLTYTCPLTVAEADRYGVAYRDTYTEDGTYGPAGKTYITLSQLEASAYCANLGNGYRLPSQSELSALYSAKGNMYNSAGWPATFYYWSSTEYNATGEYWVTYLDDGNTFVGVSDYTNYVSCVRGGS